MVDRLNIAKWLQNEFVQAGLPEFLELIQEYKTGITVEALQPGDTDFAKGKAVAFQEILDLPEQLIKEIDKKNSDDTTDTSQGD